MAEPMGIIHVITGIDLKIKKQKHRRDNIKKLKNSQNYSLILIVKINLYLKK